MIARDEDVFPGSATIDYSSLVLQELQQSVAELKSEIKEFLNTGASHSQHRADNLCEQIINTLELLDRRGARLIAEEVQLLLRSRFIAVNDVKAGYVDSLMTSDSFEHRDNADTTHSETRHGETQRNYSEERRLRESHVMLLLGCERLAEYLDYLKAGGADLVPALLPLVNNLRACRGSHLLSENLLAASAFNLPESSDSLVGGADARDRFFETVRQCRHPVMLAVLAWYQTEGLEQAVPPSKTSSLVKPKPKKKSKKEPSEKQNSQDSREDLLPLLSRLEKDSPTAALQDFWRAAHAVCISVLDGSLEFGPAIRQLLGQIERYLKELLDYQLDRNQLRLPRSLYKNLLYYVGLSTSADHRVRELADRFGLHSLLPENESAAGLVEQFRDSRFNADLAVVDSLVTEVDSIREFISDYAETGLPETEEIKFNSVRLQQVAATFMLLGDKNAEECAQHAARILDDAALNPDPVQLHQLARNLIALSDTLEEMQQGVSSSRLFIGGFDPEMLNQRKLSAHKMDNIVRQCMLEARKAIETVESAYLEVLELSAPGGEIHSDAERAVSQAGQRQRQTVTDKIETCAESLSNTKQSLMILPLPELTPMLDAAASYLRWYRNEKIDCGVPDALSRDFADLLVNSSVYLDNDVHAQSGASDLLQNAENAMQRLQQAMQMSAAELEQEFADGFDNQFDDAFDNKPGQLLESHSTMTDLHADSQFPESGKRAANDAAAIAGLMPQQNKLSLQNKENKGSLADRSDQLVASRTASVLAANQAAEPGQGKFIDEALQHFEQIGRSLNDWQKNSRVDALLTMQSQYRSLALLGEKLGDDGTELVDFAQANVSMLTHIDTSAAGFANAGDAVDAGNNNEKQLTPEVEGLMQESVAVLPQLLNQLPSNIPRKPSTAATSPLSSRRDPDAVVSGLSGLLQRLKSVSEISASVPESLSAAQELDEINATLSVTHDTTQVLTTASQDSTEVNATAGTWAFGASPKTNALQTAPRINTPLRPAAIQGASLQPNKPKVNELDTTAAIEPDTFDEISDFSHTESDADADVHAAETNATGDLTEVLDSGTLRAPEYTSQQSLSGARDFESTQELSPETAAKLGAGFSAAYAANGDEASEEFTATQALDHDQGDDSYGWQLPDPDSTLFSVFEAECSGHLATLRGVTSVVMSSGSAVPVTERFVQALHTLHGSALAAGEAGIVSIAEPFEQLAIFYHRKNASPDLDQWREFSDCVETLSAALDVRAVGSDARDITEKTAAQLRSSLESLKQTGRTPVFAEQTAELNKNSKSDHQAQGLTGQSAAPRSTEQRSTGQTSTRDSRQQQLFDIFLDEAAELLARMQSAHDELLPIQDDFTAQGQQAKDTALRDVLRQLHTLKGSARVAGSEAVATLAHHTESALMVWHKAGRAGERCVDGKRCELLQASIDALLINTDQARQGGEPGDFDLLVSELNQDLEVTEQATTGNTDLDETLELNSDDLTAVTAGFEATVLNNILNNDQVLSDEQVLNDDQALSDDHEVSPDMPEADTTLSSAPDAVDDTLSTATLNLEDSVASKNIADVETEKMLSGIAGNKPGDRPASGTVHLDGAVVDRLSNLSTEVSVHHARLNQGLGTLQKILLDLDRTTASLRQKLRDLDYESAVMPDATLLPGADYKTEKSSTDANLSAVASDSSETTDMDATLGLPDAAGLLDARLHSDEDSRQLTEILHDLDTIRGALHERLRSEEETLASASRLGNDMHESIVQAKLVRFDQLRSRLESTVRQSSRVTGRAAQVHIKGGAIAIDRDVHRKLAAPLEHLLRNAVAHGIEEPAVRQQRDKPETGEIVVSAELEGSDLIVEVSDDGGGIDIDKIRELAGLADATDREVLEKLLGGGISTRISVDMVSGRGIGLESIVDLLREVDAEIEIVSSDANGTCMRMRIPQNVLINHAVVAEFNGCLLGIPANFVRRVISADDLSGLDAAVDFLDLAALLGLNERQVTETHSSASDWLDSAETDSQRIVIAADGREMYLEPQHVLGFRDLVTRPLGVQLASLGVYTGASLQSDGSQIMVLDATRLMRRHKTQSHENNASNKNNPEAVPANIDGETFTSGELTADDTANLTTSQLRGFVDKIDFGSADPSSGSGDTQHSILVVDDSVTLRAYTCGIVQNSGLSTIEARDGYEALEALKHMPEPPAAMVVDIEMPRMDGFTLIAALRKIHRLENLPVIMISSRSGTYNRLRARELGVQGFLGKPYREKDLQRLLSKLQLVETDSVH